MIFQFQTFLFPFFLILDFSNGQEVEQKIKIEANVVFQLLTFTSKKILSSDLYIII